MRRLILPVVAVVVAGALVWRHARLPPAPAQGNVTSSSASSGASAPAGRSDDLARSTNRSVENRVTAQPTPLRRCFPADASGAPARPLDALLDRAADLFESQSFEASLACAEEASRVDPASVEAHHERADALRELKRLGDAQDAFARALSLDPDDPRTLDGAADFYVNRLAPTADHLETGLSYARRGTRKLKRSHDRSLVAHLALLEGEALSDLGRSREAIGRLEAALALDPENIHITYERGVAEFELCRFTDAQRDFERVIKRDPKDAGAHHQLGLVLERVGESGSSVSAARELSRAESLAPADFKPPILPSVEEFRALVDEEVRRLPENLKKDLAQCTLETADLPDLADLTAEEPPLSPTILGLFRGAPLDDPHADAGEGRTIVIYRKNLARAVSSREELVVQILTTLLHELGHVRGEDDEDLRARGLE